VELSYPGKDQRYQDKTITKVISQFGDELEQTASSIWRNSPFSTTRFCHTKEEDYNHALFEDSPLSGDLFHAQSVILRRTGACRK
jgi:hypothetical protein